MFQEIERTVSSAIEREVAQQFGLTVKVALEQPKQTSFGELAIPTAFQLARQLRRPPREIAQSLGAGLAHQADITSVEIAGNGYINVRLNRGRYVRSLIETRGKAELSGAETAGKIIVEHTNINPNKAAHIGHLRNAILGDTFVRMLRRLGNAVEVQNYIDNTGVQVADVVAAFHYLEKKGVDDIRALISDANLRFDYLCWDLYARVSAYYKEDPAALEWRAETLHAIEAGHGELAELGKIVGDAIVELHLQTMYRLCVQYDLLPRESEILHLKFWTTAFELLKQRGAIHFETQGKNANCWVMHSSQFRGEDGAEEDSKVIVRSNGTVTYVGKDIAYQLWKFGLLGRDFFYRPWSSYPDGHELWVTTDQPNDGNPPHFGGAAKVFNVIDSRQSYLQDVVVAGLRTLDFNAQADASIHFSYEMVALSPRTCVELGIALSEDDKRKPYIEVSGRKGLGVKADDLIDKLIETALAEVEDRHPEAEAAERQDVAKQIAVGALRYFMLKFTRNSVIAFDFHEALSFEGETGPYVQYAAVRAGNILRKFVERASCLPQFEQVLNGEALNRWFEDEDLWQLVLLASKSDSAVARAIASGEPAHVAKYAFQLAQAFNNFYHGHQVIAEPDEQRRAVLLWLTQYVREQLLGTLSVLGIEQPPYM
ncbi:MAG: arginine--tRNA ligase [Acidobacteriaceae bacterium]|nr:arginine--tRNA ligase [Acidobacteriaceae bacterium]MBV9296434.1 arginine--tRNA ligase [Acidobacteriaceae bacterium]MBV9763974.1 arginine--tRNA ligase [Acidobacteriaceae bacterium]